MRLQPTQGSTFEWIERLQTILPDHPPVYLVGGAVRDLLLQRPTHDLDFVLTGDVLRTARRVANAVGGAFYPLDEARETGRVLVDAGGRRQVLDFAALRGPDLESDLRARDFTVNAMALEIRSPQSLIDPLGGAADLRQGLLRACAPTSFQDDPVRILRAVRLALALNLHIIPETREWMRASLQGLERVSPERMRGEIFRILDGRQPAAGIRALDMLGALAYILPDLETMRGVTQSAPHISDVWDHTLNVVQNLGNVLGVLGLEHDPDAVVSWALGMVSVRLGRYRQALHEHMQAALNPDRSHRSLLFLAALYHDAGKPATRTVEPGGRVRFLEHEDVSEELARTRGQAFRLSNLEIERLRTIVRGHMRPLLLAQGENLPSRRAVYRFFRDTGAAGVDICLLSLADVLATYGPTLPREVWMRHLDVVRSLLDAWWENTGEHIAPPALVSGHELIREFRLKPGPLVGQMLEAIREAQAAGEVKEREQALAVARRVMNEQAGAE